jgi:hypothetical protein
MDHISRCKLELRYLSHLLINCLHVHRRISTQNQASPEHACTFPLELALDNIYRGHPTWRHELGVENTE